MASTHLQLFNDVVGQVNEEAAEVMLDGPMIERGETLLWNVAESVFNLH